MNGKRLKDRDNKEESTPPSEMPSGGVITKDEPAHEKLPSDSDNKKPAARVEGDGMEAHLETSDKKESTSKESTKTKDDKSSDEDKSV